MKSKTLRYFPKKIFNSIFVQINIIYDSYKKLKSYNVIFDSERFFIQLNLLHKLLE